MHLIFNLLAELQSSHASRGQIGVFVPQFSIQCYSPPFLVVGQQGDQCIHLLHFATWTQGVSGTR